MCAHNVFMVVILIALLGLTRWAELKKLLNCCAPSSKISRTQNFFGHSGEFFFPFFLLLKKPTTDRFTFTTIFFFIINFIFGCR